MLNEIPQDGKRLGPERNKLLVAPELFVDAIKTKRRKENFGLCIHLLAAPYREATQRLRLSHTTKPLCRKELDKENAH
jgi:hypothetical protein